MSKTIILITFIGMIFSSINAQTTPVDLNDIILWYSSDSVSSDVNNNISVLYDKSGNGFNAVQPQINNQPLLVSDFNNQQVISFNGIDNYMDCNFNQTFNSPNTIFIILKDISTSGNKYYFSGLNITEGYSFYHRANLTMSVQSGGSFTQSYSKSFPYNYTLFSIQYKNGSFIIRENGVQMDQKTTGTGTLKGFRVGARFDINYFFDGNISEIIAYNRNLDSTEISFVENYMVSKFSPSVNLGQNISQYGFCDTTLYAGKRFESYLWSDGSIADSLIVSEPGTYWVETVDIFGFISRDTIQVLSGLNYPTTQLYCQNNSITWQTGLGQHYSYLWSDNSTGDTLIIYSPGDYHVTVTDTNGCVFESDTLTFAEDPFSTLATLGPDTSLCSGNQIELTAGANSAINYLWNTAETTPEITISTTGTYSVIVQNANGCEVKDTIDVTILGDAPTINTQFPTTVCVNETFNFQDLSTTTDGSTIIGWHWNLGDGTTSSLDQGNHAYSASGIYNLDLTVETSAGCFNNQTATIEVKENPIVTYAASNQCEEESIQFNGGQMSPQTIMNWEWNFDDPASGIDNMANGQNVAHTYNSFGDYDVMLIGTDVFGCVDTLIQTKTIAPTPVADFTFTEVCEGSTVDYQNLSVVAGSSVISGNQWSFGDGTSSNQNNPQKPYSLYGTYTVNLTTTANNGCSNSVSKSIKIHATPQPQYSVEQDCAGLETAFEDLSFVPDGSVAQVDWVFNNQSPISGFDITNVFQNSGTYSLEQTVTSGFGCSNSANSTVTINPYLNADFTFTPNAFIADYSILFESTSTGENEYLWRFGNFATSTLANTTVIFDESQIGTEQTVELRVKNEFECRDSVSVKLNVMDQRTDLEISQIFSQDINGFLTIGVRLKNIGSTPISEVDLVLNSPKTGFIKETWLGMLQADEEEIYIFSANPSAKISAEDTLQNFLCIEGNIIQPAQFEEEDLSNNEVCKTMTDNQTVIVFPYPNPVKDELTVKVVMPKKGVIALSVYDDRGKLVYMITENQELEKGLNVFVVETSTWGSGRYSIVYDGEGKVPGVGFVKI